VAQRAVLQPFQNGDGESSPFYFWTRNLRKFFVSHPNAIDGLAPDMLWFCDLMATAKPSKEELEREAS
jgi:hypothetical protein